MIVSSTQVNPRVTSLFGEWCLHISGLRTSTLGAFSVVASVMLDFSAHVCTKISRGVTSYVTWLPHVLFYAAARPFNFLPLTHIGLSYI